MKRILQISTIVFMSISISGFSQEDVQPFTGNAAISFSSNYVWRGQKLSPGTVSQPTVGLFYKGFNVNLWSNFSNKDSETTETDFTVSYSFATSITSFDIGYINYAFDGFKDTQEFYGAVGFDVLLSPGATFYYDFDEGNGGFLIASIGHSIAISESISLDLGFSGSMNFNNAIMGVNAAGEEFSGLYNADISAGVTIPLFDAVSLQPYAAYTFPLSNDAEAAIKTISFDGDSDLLYGGVGFSLDL